MLLALRPDGTERLEGNTELWSGLGTPAPFPATTTKRRRCSTSCIKCRQSMSEAAFERADRLVALTWRSDDSHHGSISDSFFDNFTVAELSSTKRV